MFAPSSDGVEVAVHDLGGSGRTLLVSHATGFHGRVYAPLAAAVADQFHTWALDYRGHGDTPAPAGVDILWDRFGDDAVAAAHAVAPEGGLVGFGHSMGGAALLMAAHREPALFDVLVLFEPIVFAAPDVQNPRPPSPMPAAARRRRRSFPSYEAAIENYRSKPPLDKFHEDALRAYVEYGFAPSAEGVTLRCDPEYEARTFEGSWAHGTFDALPEIETPVVVASGKVEELQASTFAAVTAERLPNATYIELAHLDHFGPMTDPDEIAELIAEAAAR